ncbi:MAG: flagellin [Maricaulaceae bacterium]
MTLSINTNQSALIALQNLNATNAELEEVQNTISTGLAIGSAEDSASVFAIAQGLRADTGALDAVTGSLDRAISIGEVALTAGETVSDLLIELRTVATRASDVSIDTFARDALQEDFASLIEQIQLVVDTADFDGANILDNSVTTGIAFLADADATQTLTLGAQNFTFGGPNITLTAAASVATITGAQDALTAIEASIDEVNLSLGNLGADLRTLEAHRTFVGNLQDSLTVGIGNLVDADLAVESAQLQALQVQQQLATTSLSIANTAPQAILGLFG